MDRINEFIKAKQKFDEIAREFRLAEVEKNYALKNIFFEYSGTKVLVSTEGTVGLVPRYLERENKTWVFKFPEEDTIPVPLYRIQKIHIGQFGHLCIELSEE